MKCSCLGCTKREVGCHSTCEDYIRYREERTEIRKKVYESKMKDYVLEDRKQNGIRRVFHKK